MNAIVQSLGEFGKVRLAVMGGVALLLLGFFIMLSMQVSSPVMTPLYSNVPLEESGDIVAELEQMNIPYSLSAGGRQILVPGEFVEQARVKLAGQGLPSSGSAIGYEVFDEGEALGTSNFVLNVNKMRAMEGELGRTISSLRRVDSARVHLVIPRRELFTRERREPTASVALKVRGAGPLEKNEIAAIRHLVATSVPGLLPTRITIVDQNGNLLARGADDENDAEVIAANAEEFRTGLENKLEKTIESLLEKSVGFGRVQAEVNADIDFDRIVTDSETFDPEGQVARSVQTIEENEEENERDVRDNVTAANNLPDADPENAGFTNARRLQRTDETTNFEISKTVQSHIKQTGTVNRLSVAVLIDGVYTTNEEGVETYQPRSEAELEQLETLVRSAVGYDADRGDTVEVVNMQFSDTQLMPEPSPFAFLADDFASLIQTIIMAGVAIMVIMMIIRPLVQRAIAAQDEAVEEDEEFQRLLASPGLAPELADLTGEGDEDAMISIDKIDGNVKSSLYRKVSEMIDSHPEESLNVIRQWAFEIDES